MYQMEKRIFPIILLRVKKTSSIQYCKLQERKNLQLCFSDKTESMHMILSENQIAVNRLIRQRNVI